MKIIDFFNFGGYLGAPKNPKNGKIGGFGAPQIPPKIKKIYFFGRLSVYLDKMLSKTVFLFVLRLF